MAKIPESKFPVSAANSYERNLSEMVKLMTEYTYLIFKTEIEKELIGFAKQFKSDSAHRLDDFKYDGFLDKVTSALKKAKDFTKETFFNAKDTVRKATSFVRQLNVFNKNISNNQKATAGFNEGNAERWEQDFLKANIAANVNLISSIHEDYHNRIEIAVMNAAKYNLSVTDLAERIKDIASATESRATLIAEDQAGKINAQLAAVRSREAGAKRFEWISKKDSRVRPLHQKYDGEIFYYDDPPEGQLPGEPIRCRCEARPIFDDEE